MSNAYPVNLHPPRDWQVFEGFCRELAEAEWGHASLHGRSGQRQRGVDVYGFQGKDGGWIGIQCKHKEPGKELTLEEIEAEVRKANGFEPTLARLVFATTAPRDEKAQAAERAINDGALRAAEPGFRVALWFWDDLVGIVEKHPQVYKRWRRRLSLGQDPQISTHRLPASTTAELIGREEELARLDEAWAEPKTHAISLIAVGGAGKTALVTHWLQRLERDDWRGAEAVFAWSFYSQGAGEDRQASGAQFFLEAFGFFDEEMPTTGGPRAPGVRLAELVRERNVLLALDGLEPLQYGPTDSRAGRIKDPAVQALVRELATSQPGLLVLTSRQEVADLRDKRETSAPVMDLGRLGTAAGVHLLSTLSVKGRAGELETVVEEVHGHALTLTLLGTYLAAAHKGDIRAWHDLPLLAKAEDLGDSHASRVIAAYTAWFGEGPERQILSLLGLFDRPAEAEALAALRKEPAIRGLTDRLVDLSQPRWNIALKRLRDARLILEELGREKEIDAHPLVREHFGRVLETESPEAYRAGHQRLYEHYASAAPYQPDTLEEMEPLYRAIGHGCRAGRRQEVLDKVYRQRVHRGNEHFSWRKLGAFGPELTALASFFERTWDHPAEELRPEAQSALLNQAGTCLRALGRLGEATAPIAAGLKGAIQEEDWKKAADYSENLSELSFTLGQVNRFAEVARVSVALAERSGDTVQRINNRSTLADALHAAGQLAEAAATLQEAEALQAELELPCPKLYSTAGFKYCDLLLTRAAPLDGSGLDWARAMAAGEEARRWCEEVLDRAVQALEWSTAKEVPLDIALDHLSLSRARLGLDLATGCSFDDSEAEANEAIQNFRHSSNEYALPLGLLTRAALHRFANNPAAAQADLAEALEIAERGQMRLHECDAHLEWGRLCWSVGDRDGAKAHLETARRLVAETGYHRRDREVGELAAALGVSAPTAGGAP